MSTEIVHDEFGLSKSPMWLGCPGSVNRSRGLPDQKTEAAERGNRIHAACDAISRKIPIPAEVNPDELALAVAMEAHGLVLASHYGATPESINSTEVPQDVSILGIERDGHIDRLWVLEDFVIILDYKSGAFPVYAEGNSQLAGYAVSAAKEYGVKRAICLIVQPSFDGTEIGGSAWIMEEEDLLEWESRLRTGKRIAERSTVLIPGEVQCRYCRAKDGCEARAGILHQILSTAAADVWNLVEGMTDEQRGDLVARLSEGASWAKALHEAVAQHLQTTGLAATGYKWKPGAKKRVWSDPALAERALLLYADTAGIPHESIRPIGKAIKGPSDLEKDALIPPEIYAGLIEVTENKSSLVVATGRSKRKDP